MASHPDLPISPYEPLRPEPRPCLAPQRTLFNKIAGGPEHRFLCVDEDGFRGLVETLREYQG